MIKKFIFIILLFSMFLTTSVLAKPVDTVRDFKLSNNAVEVTPNVFNLGRVYDPQSHGIVEGYAIVHKKANARNSSAKGPKAPACYGFLAKDAKWKNVENWTVFTGAGLDENFVLNNITDDIAKWETAAGTPDILGAGSFGVGIPGDPNILDEKNEVFFAHISESNTIAVTIVWGIFSGPTFNRKLVAWDQIYNTDYPWSENAEGSTTQMDFENIATHELGHSVGMGDIYNSSCSEVTMYGYGKEGEIKKRDLAPADITGINNLY